MTFRTQPRLFTFQSAVSKHQTMSS